MNMMIILIDNCFCHNNFFFFALINKLTYYYITVGNEYTLYYTATQQPKHW